MRFKALDELTSSDSSQVGGKAWNCARLKQQQFLVPDGIVVPANADEPDLAQLLVHPWFSQWSSDRLFAVRSSGLSEDAPEQSFAGIHETHLNVSRGELLEAVRACRASAASDRAKAYRQSRAVTDESTATGVLVQLMIPSVSAGVAFTVDPLSGDSGEIIINAAAGLGTSVVDGQVEPDEIRVAKEDAKISLYRTGATSQRVLTDEEVRELAALVVRIEQHYKAPQDVEWCHDGRQFWIVQARPVTVLPAGGHDTEWTRANLAEVLPEFTSPQALHASERFLEEGERRYMGTLLGPEDELGPMVKSFYGRMYFNLSQLRHLSRLVGSAPADVMRSLGHSGRIDPEDEIARRPQLSMTIKLLPQLGRMLRRYMSAGRLMRAHVAMVDEYTGRLRSMHPETMSDQAMWVAIDEWRLQAPKTLEVILIFGGVLFYEQPLKRICTKSGFSYERLLGAHLAAGQRSVSAQQAFDLVALANTARQDPKVADWLRRSDDLVRAPHALAGTSFGVAFNAFLDRYGHRGLYESDWALPRYREDPTPLLKAIQMHVRDDRPEHSDRTARVEDEASRTRAEFERSVRGIGRFFALARVRRLLGTIKQYYLWREQCRSDMVRVIAAVRAWHLVLARRFVGRGWLEEVDDYFFVRLDEIERVIAEPTLGPGLRGIAAARAAEMERFRQIPMPLLMRESELPRLVRSAASVILSVDGDDELRGLPVSRGCVEGEVVVIDHPGDFDQMKPGAILVTRATDPSWTPLFTLASGVIVEVGGMLSHASTIAREYGLPALANVPQATRRLQTGDWITLNANEGYARKSPRYVKASA